MFLLTLQFVVCSLLIMASGNLVAKCGHRIARGMNWHDGFVGVLFLAFATSMPEFFTSISSVPQVFAVNKINLGFGDAMGSLVINLMLVSILDLSIKRGRLLQLASRDHIATGGYTMLLLAFLAIFTFLRQYYKIGFSIFNIGIESFIIIGIYIWGMKAIFKKRHVEENPKTTSELDKSQWAQFLALLVAIFILGIWLANIGNKIVDETNINQNFIGTCLLAFSTSLPELAVSLSALRMGSVNMCIGNVLGSNFFDVCIIPMMDIVYRRAPILLSIDVINIFTTLLAFMLTAILISGLHYGTRDEAKKVGWTTALIIIFGFIGYYVIYSIG